MNPKAQKKVLNSAVAVFAEKGYREASIAEIVRGAGANIAAVNYYFGSKDKLFLAALRQAFKLADEAFPSRGGLADDAGPREKLSAVARAILLRSFDAGKGGDFNRIMSRTMHAPGSPIALILREVSQLELSYIEACLTDFFETNSQPLIHWAVSLFLAMATLISKRPNGLDGIFPATPEPAQRDAFIDFQITALFAALDALPQQFPLEK